MKNKLVIYNTLLMVVMVVLVLIFMVSISGNVVQVGSENILREVVHDNVEEIEYKRSSYDFSDVDLFDDGVTTLIYSSSGSLLYGSFKNELLDPLLDSVITKTTQNGVDYLVYDKYVQYNNDDGIFVRGIISITSETRNINMLLLIGFTTLPIFIFISAFGSYFICKKSMKPLYKMIDTTEKIILENDLSLRINHSKGNDEVSRLAKSFDEMIAKVEYTLEKEKRFSCDVSHELRTPIAVILSQCELDENNETTGLIKKQALKIRLIINQLFSLVRLENGVDKVELEVVNLSELVDLVCHEHSDIIATELITDIEPSICINLDYSMVMRILVNLISNSAKYIGDGNLIKVSLHRNNDEVTLVVEDNGIGISKDHIGKVFDRFFTVDSSRTDQDSMGLGLSIVKQMVELNSGIISLDSEVGKGTIVTITFKGEEK